MELIRSLNFHFNRPLHILGKLTRMTFFFQRSILIFELYQGSIDVRFVAFTKSIREVKSPNELLLLANRCWLFDIHHRIRRPKFQSFPFVLQFLEIVVSVFGHVFDEDPRAKFEFRCILNLKFYRVLYFSVETSFR